ncbi:MAG: hypothetical protein JKY42_10370 [Flavobacteriales bacterium]|nr:hypothetical protein [Flavobacteriales bacterium]
MNNKAAFEYQQDEEDVFSALVAFKELEDLLPKDKNIKYNICVLQLKAWLLGQATIEQDALKKSIEKLSTYGINTKLEKRLLINFNIISSEYYMYQRQYDKKDVALNYIYKNYKYLKLAPSDYLQLSKYFSSYTRYDWAEKILKPQVIKIDVDEDLLFYYINLTMVDPENTKRSSYRTIMLNAANVNKARYCNMFKPYRKGGVSFQLLGDEYLKESYCESCQ